VIKIFQVTLLHKVVLRCFIFNSYSFPGLSTRDEMCLGFILYYPRQRLADCRSLPALQTVIKVVLSLSSTPAISSLCQYIKHFINVTSLHQTLFLPLAYLSWFLFSNLLFALTLKQTISCWLMKCQVDKIT
jgi:Copper type II ascorbate-dependent monooxygenase, C-terminal domain